MGRISPRRLGRLMRHKRVRRKVRGTPDRPRLVVFRSARHIYAQVVDDTVGHTVVSAASTERVFGELAPSGGNRQGAQALGRLLAMRAVENGITRVVFDRNGYFFHGRVKALADAAREGGLVF